MNLPSPKHAPQFGNQTIDVALLEEQYEMERDDAIAKVVKLCKQMENDGATDCHKKLQPKVSPVVDNSLIGSEIELLYSCDYLTEVQLISGVRVLLRWSRLEIEFIYNGVKAHCMKVIFQLLRRC